MNLQNSQESTERKGRKNKKRERKWTVISHFDSLHYSHQEKNYIYSKRKHNCMKFQEHKKLSNYTYNFNEHLENLPLKLGSLFYGPKLSCKSFEHFFTYFLVNTSANCPCCWCAHALPCEFSLSKMIVYLNVFCPFMKY